MKTRKRIIEQIPESFLVLLDKKLAELKKQYRIDGVIALPSSSWASQDLFLKHLSEKLAAPILPEFLFWRDFPAARQGELHNNDQRRYNVTNKMSCARKNKLSENTILLFDDYIGSGSTMKEAIRVLRKETLYKGTIIPLAIACVKWRLGKPGII